MSAREIKQLADKMVKNEKNRLKRIIETHWIWHGSLKEL
jgi:hypothetical protein